MHARVSSAVREYSGTIEPVEDQSGMASVAGACARASPAPAALEAGSAAADRKVCGGFDWEGRLLDGCAYFGTCP